jgi:hypothetical protein
MTTQARVIFVPATRKDLEVFYPHDFPWTFKAVAARIVDADGGEETVGIGGVYYDRNNVVAFSSFDPKIDAFPVAKARGVMKVMEIVRNRPCVAIASEDHPGAPKLLERLGFEQLDGRIYRWKH